jgi:ABC-type nitrate/sulfonate/bicarbonate transport system ATPase subunit
MIEIQNVADSEHRDFVHRRVAAEFSGAEPVSATFASGSVTCLDHADGSSPALLRAIAGFTRFSGSVRAALYVCFDDAPVLSYLSGYENVSLLGGRSMSKRELDAMAPEIADASLLRMSARRLSAGQRHRVHLLAAFASRARYLVFDVTSGDADAPSPAEIDAASKRCAPTATVIMTDRRNDRRNNHRLGGTALSTTLLGE